MCCTLGQHHVLLAVHSTQTPSPTFRGKGGLRKGLQSTDAWKSTSLLLNSLNEPGEFGDSPSLSLSLLTCHWCLYSVGEAIG